MCYIVGKVLKTSLLKKKKYTNDMTYDDLQIAYVMNANKQIRKKTVQIRIAKANQ